MDNPSKRERVTVTASVKGVERAKKSMIRLGFRSKEAFAESSSMGKSTVNKFFQRQPMEIYSFEKICQELELDDWRTVAELEDILEQILPVDIDNKESAMAYLNDPKVSSVTRVITFHPCEGEVESEITLEGDIASVNDNFKLTIEALINSKLGINITVKDIKRGSIKVTVKGSQEDIAKLLDWINSGDVKDLNGFPVQNVQVLSPDFLSNIDTQSISDVEETVLDINQEAIQITLNLSVSTPRPSQIIQTLCQIPFIGNQLLRIYMCYANLRKVNLSDANLSNANLSGINLSGVDLSSADLSGVDLSSANLSRADLSSANLSGVNLSGVDLIGANLSRAYLSSANISGANIRRANLSNADLSNTDLSNTDLSNADLSNADLSGANLSGANFEKAKVQNCQFGHGNGLAESTKTDLKQRGAIFDDAPGDRSSVLSRR